MSKSASLAFRDRVQGLDERVELLEEVREMLQGRVSELERKVYALGKVVSKLEKGTPEGDWWRSNGFVKGDATGIEGKE